MTISPEQLRRIELTTACRDCESIPKMDGAGSVIARDGRTVQVMHNGVLVEAGSYYGEWMTELIRRLHGHHEPQEEAVFHEVLGRLAVDTRAPVMMELGCFWSYYSLWLLHTAPTGRCVLVEPDPANLAAGRRNFGLNGATGEFLHATVGSEHGVTAPFECESDGVVREVRQVSIDGLLHDLGLEHLDIVLCDVQGAELEALAGARDALADGRIRFMVISTHHHSISSDPLTHQRCLRFLEEAGTQIVVEHTVSESCSGDGLIVASADPRDRGWQLEVSRTRAKDSLFGELEVDLAAALKGGPSAG